MIHALNILHLEDREDDAVLFQRAVGEGDKKVRVHWVSNAFEGKAYLLGEGKYSDREQYPFPNVVVADLRLPGLSGYDFVDWLTEESPFSALPVLILTNSNLKQDAATAESIGINFFFEKPATFQAWKTCAATVIKACFSLLKRDVERPTVTASLSPVSPVLRAAPGVFRGI